MAGGVKVSAEERLGVPEASFIEEVESYMQGKVVDQVIGELTARMQKYKLVETQLAQRKATIALKIPEIRKSLEAVRLLDERKKAGQVRRGAVAGNGGNRSATSVCCVVLFFRFVSFRFVSFRFVSFRFALLCFILSYRV